ncbi:hypothetical protein [Paracoccus sp. IB05]|nr:hypothetical protein [Paracoccus sp. IB05]MBJ2150686.1 hypothetical protein [Paracoccus sp. IB05]
MVRNAADAFVLLGARILQRQHAKTFDPVKYAPDRMMDLKPLFGFCT